MRTRFPAALRLTVPVLLLCNGALRADQPTDKAGSVTFPTFRMQEIDKSLKIGYAVKLVDLNGDGKLDILVCDANRVIWFENPTWKMHTITEGKVKADNVCIEPFDINGDGKLDLFLGADWQPNNTKDSGSLQWLEQGKNIDDPWTVHPIAAPIPTLHRIHMGKIDGKPMLIVGPLKGRDSTAARNNMDTAVQLLAFPIPKEPGHDEWKPQVLTDTLHVMHNFLPLDNDKRMEVLTASYEGISLVGRAAGDQRTVVQIGAGEQKNPNGSRGSSEVKIGHLKDGREMIGAIEPFHGNEVVVYTPPDGAKQLSATAHGPPTLWTRTVLNDTYQGGHDMWFADLDGDGTDEIIAGWRDGHPKTGIDLYKATPDSSAPGGLAWHKHELDRADIAPEDLAAADLNGDGKIDIVAVGRATHNVRIYWNEGTK